MPATILSHPSDAGKSGVGLVSKAAQLESEEPTTPVVKKLNFRKKKSLHGKGGGAGAPGFGTLGRVTVSQRAVARSDRVLELMIGDLENLKLELRSLQTANKESASTENQHAAITHCPVSTRGMHDSIRKLEFRAHQLEKAQAPLRKAWNGP